MRAGVKLDPDVPTGIKIELPMGNIRIIHYSPRHFIALKEAFKIFSKDEQNEGQVAYDQDFQTT